jgi:pilus assembly protein Flp/PilA
MANIFRRIASETTGATAIEYGLIAGLLAVVIMASVVGMASEVSKTYSKTGAAMTTANA